MTTSQGESFPSVIHIEKGKVFEGTSRDESRILDLNAVENRTLVQALQTEGRSSATEWPDGNYRVEGDRLMPMDQ